jgi:dipeptidase
MRILLSLLVAASISSYVCGCTTFVITKAATKDGSVLAAHSADGGGNTDPRLVRIPGATFATGSVRNVYGSPESYPRYIGNPDPRSPQEEIKEYLSENCVEGAKYCQEFPVIGTIPQVEKTFSYYEAVYGVQNEHEVGISESTCSSVYTAKALNNGGKALFSINALSQIAMERATTAREAVRIMGQLSQKYGFYGASASFEGGAESLIVTDRNEGWVFHILADPTGSSSIWVGARVPDGHAAVVANMFSVRDVDLDDTQNFEGRQDMWELAESEGLWSKGQPKDWTATFSDGEYAHKYYSGRRMWGVFRLVAPETKLPPLYDNLKTSRPYPFSVPVSVNKEDVGPSLMFKVMRDYYNGTEFSLGSPKPAGGPFGTIDRYGGQEAGDAVQVQGNWERSIALYRTAESYIVQSGGYKRNYDKNSTHLTGGVVWFGAHSSTYTVYVPLVSGGVLQVPPSLSEAWQGVYKGEKDTSNFWASRSLSMMAQIKWDYMMPDIQAMQYELESNSEQMVQDIYNKYDNSKNNDIDMDTIQKIQNTNIAKAPTESRKLFHKLLFRFADGFDNAWSGTGDSKHFSSGTPGYPGWWLESVKYSQGPPPP